MDDGVLMVEVMMVHERVKLIATERELIYCYGDISFCSITYKSTDKIL